SRRAGGGKRTHGQQDEGNTELHSRYSPDGDSSRKGMFGRVNISAIPMPGYRLSLAEIHGNPGGNGIFKVSR
ncbi:MAG: hypothetical protein RH951_05685, partial [Parvibaculum sp.]